VLTVHPRYHSFYVFLLDEFWKRDRPRTASSWRAFFRPREFMYSVAAHLAEHAERWPEHDGMSGIVGANRTGPLASEATERYAPVADYIKSALGGYGLYYRSVMAELGVIFLGGPGFATPVDIPTDDVGRQLAEAFRTAIKGTTYFRQYFDVDEVEVPRSVLQEYADAACLCRLAADDAPDRPLLLDVFLHGGNEAAASARRATLRFILDLANQTEGHPLSQGVFRQLIYFGSADGGLRYVASEGCEDAAVGWRVYQLREYFNYALNSIWRALCDFGYQSRGDDLPLSAEHLDEFITTGLAFDLLAQRHGLLAPGLNSTSRLDEVLAWLEGIVGLPPESLRAPYDSTTVLHEQVLMRAAMGEPRSAVDGFSGMIALLLVLFNRLRSVDSHSEPVWRLLRLGGDGRLPIDGFDHAFMPRLREYSDSGRTIGDFVRWLVDGHIVLQHQLVASQKLPDDTYRFRQEAGAVRFFRFENQVDQRNSRFDALSTTVAELGLCERLDRSHHPLRPDGEELLTRGDIG
jgi:hypothetical protein